MGNVVNYLWASLLSISLATGSVAGTTPVEQYTRLSEAIKAGDTKTIDQILDAGAEVNFKPDGKPSLLRTAIYAKNHSAARKLLNHKADITLQEGFYKGTAIMFAADSSDIEMVDLLLQNGANINSRDGGYGDAAINWAAYAGHLEMVEHLLENGADPRIVGHGNALNIAMRRGFQPMVELLAESMAETRTLSESEQRLLSAIEKDDAAAAEKALAEGANANGLDRFKRPIIATAARRGALDALKLLLRSGAEADAEDPIGYTALMEAARDKQLACVRFLLDHGAAVNHLSNERGLKLTALHLAAIGGSVEVVEALVSHGAKLNVKGTIGTTPLLWGLFEGSIAAAIRLVELGADPTLGTKTGYNAINFAADSHEEELAAAIAAYSETTANGPTP